MDQVPMLRFCGRLSSKSAGHVQELVTLSQPSLTSREMSSILSKSVQYDEGFWLLMRPDLLNRSSTL